MMVITPIIGQNEHEKVLHSRIEFIPFTNADVVEAKAFLNIL